MILILFFSLFFLAILWLGLVLSLFSAMSKNHPEMYLSLGSPRGFEPKTTEALFRFLLSRRPESLGDKNMMIQVTTMRILLPIYVLGFAILVFLVVQSDGGPN